MSSSEVLQTFLAIIGALSLFVLNNMSKSVNEATKSISTLNERMGVIVEKIERHDKEIIDMQGKQDQSRERMHELANNINGLHSRITRD